MLATDELQQAAEYLLGLASKSGVAFAEVYAEHHLDFEVKVCNGHITALSEAENRGLGLRLIHNQALGFAASSDLRPASMQQLFAEAKALTEIAAANPAHALPPTAGAITAQASLPLYDANIANLSTKEKIAWAHAMEAAAKDCDEKITTFRDSGVASRLGHRYIYNSNGLFASDSRTGLSVWCCPVATLHHEKQTEAWYSYASALADIEAPEAVAKMAAQRSLRMLGAKTPKAQKVPVVFENTMTAGLMGSLVAAMRLSAVDKQMSCLKNKLGETIASELLCLRDTPHAKQPGCALFDDEGRPTKPCSLIEKGVLQRFLSNTYYARRCQQPNTAHAQRSHYASLPGIGPFFLEVLPGNLSLQALLNLPRVLLVTRGLGSGLNVATGEYSRGINGLWIEHGEVVHPVHEATLAGHLHDMLGNIDALGNDVLQRNRCSAPSLRIAEMTVGGGA